MFASTFVRDFRVFICLHVDNMLISIIDVESCLTKTKECLSSKFICGTCWKLMLFFRSKYLDLMVGLSCHSHIILKRSSKDMIVLSVL